MSSPFLLFRVGSRLRHGQNQPLHWEMFWSKEIFIHGGWIVWRTLKILRVLRTQAQQHGREMGETQRLLLCANLNHDRVDDAFIKILTNHNSYWKCEERENRRLQETLCDYNNKSAAWSSMAIAKRTDPNQGNCIFKCFEGDAIFFMETVQWNKHCQLNLCTYVLFVPGSPLVMCSVLDEWWL